MVSGGDPGALALARLASQAQFETVLIRAGGPESPPPFAGVTYLRSEPAAALARLVVDRWTAYVGATHEDEHDLPACLAAVRGGAGLDRDDRCQGRAPGVAAPRLPRLGRARRNWPAIRFSPGIAGAWQGAVGSRDRDSRRSDAGDEPGGGARLSFAAVVLAAGSARRFGGDKLRAEFRGEPLLATRSARRGRHRWIGSWWWAMRPGEWPGDPPVESLTLPSAALSITLAAGIGAVADADGAFVFLGDMPLVPRDLAARLAGALGGHYAAAPRHHGIPGHPVLFARRAFADLRALEGDAGAGRLLRGRDDVVWLDVADKGVVLDVDRPDDIVRLSDRPNPDGFGDPRRD